MVTLDDAVFCGAETLAEKEEIIKVANIIKHCRTSQGEKADPSILKST